MNEPTLHCCAGRYCPGLSWKASDSAHPASCDNASLSDPIIVARVDGTPDQQDKAALAEETLADIEIAKRRGTLPVESIAALERTVANIRAELAAEITGAAPAVDAERPARNSHGTLFSFEDPNGDRITVKALPIRDDTRIVFECEGEGETVEFLWSESPLAQALLALWGGDVAVSAHHEAKKPIGGMSNDVLLAPIPHGFARRDAHYCACCGDECPDGKDCCSDEFPEPGDIRETGR